MQNLQHLAGARGWTWHVEREDRPARGACRLVRLSRATEAGSASLIAVSPHEPLARLPGAVTLAPATAAGARRVIERAARAERLAFGLTAAARLRGDLHPWQLAAALAFARGHARVLVADAAGMGKTVTAAIAVAEILAAEPEGRCLVLAPSHLLRQWRAELHDRLSIDATPIDAAALQRLQQELPAGLSPWSLAGCLLVSPDFIKQPHLLPSLERQAWDLLVIDEAHLVCGVSDRYRAAQLLARRARRVLLLTATPSDGGVDRLRALHTLGRAGGERLVRLRHVSTRRTPCERLLSIQPPPGVVRLHAAIEAYARWLCGARGAGPDVAVLASVLLKRAQSSAHAVHLSLARRLSLLGKAVAPAQPSLFESDDDEAVIGARSGRPEDEERRRLDELVEIAGGAAERDRRPRRLQHLVRRACEPAVIFTCFRDTALMLHHRLAPHARVRLVHGAMPRAAVDAAFDDFDAGRATLLVATDVAAHGINLHRRCRWVIHYDLPWRPPAVRQRIGRVDRLGQTARVHSTMLLDRTPLAEAMRVRLAALAARMHGDEAAGDRRWDVLAHREAGRLQALREGHATDAQAAVIDGDITVLTIELAGASGAAIERRTFALRAAPEPAIRWGHAWAAARARRLGRALAARAARLARRERAVHGALAASIPRGPAQAGLFERRALRRRDADAGDRLALHASLGDAIARHRAAARITGARIRICVSIAPAGER